MFKRKEVFSLKDPVSIMTERKTEKCEDAAPNAERIRYSDYTRTILSEGLKTGRLKQTDCAKLRRSLTDLLKEIIGEYLSTLEEAPDEYTSSIISNELLRSLLFTVDTYLISLGKHSSAVQKLRSVNIGKLREMRACGIKALKTLQYEALSICTKVEHTMPEIDCPVYRDSVEKCRKSIKEYDLIFLPHVITEEPEYPTSVSISVTGGIKYTRRYLLNLVYENMFCGSFDENSRKCFYNALLAKKGKENFSENIYKYVLISALICAFLNKEEGSLLISQSDFDSFCELTKPLSDAQLSEAFQKTASRLTYGNADYNLSALAQLFDSLQKAVRSKKSEGIIIISK